MAHSPVSAVLLDVDGTLVDSNDAHADAWVKAFAEAGIDVSFDAVRRLIGMGGDKLMPTVSGLSQDSPEGEQIAKRRGEIFSREYLPKLRPFRDADGLVAALKARNLRTVVASSAQKDELHRLLEIAGVRSLLDGAASSDDAEDSKPDPDIVEAALRKAKAPPSEAIMIGDTPYDVEAANRAGVKAIAFRCGGWDDQALRGAIAIYDGPWDLLAKLNESPLGPPSASAALGTPLGAGTRAMSILDVFERELQTGGGGFRGTHVAAAIPLTQAVVNDLLKNSGSPARDVALEIHGANRIVVNYGAFHAEVVLADAMDVGTSPTLSLNLASSVVAWTLKRRLNLPGLRVEGKRVTLDLAAVEALRAYRELWPHIKSLKFATEPGILTVVFEVLIA